MLVIGIFCSDPQGIQPIVEALYTDADFYQALYNGLSPDGILISQVGESSHLNDPFYTFSEDRHFASIINGLDALGFSSIMEYQEVRSLRKQSHRYDTIAKCTNLRSFLFASFRFGTYLE